MIHDSPVAVAQDERQGKLFEALTWYLQHQEAIRNKASLGDGVARAVQEAFRAASRYTVPAVDQFIDEVRKYRQFRNL